MEEEWKERQQAELEFVQSAYSSEEAWSTDDDKHNPNTTTTTTTATATIVHRRLDLAEDLQVCLTCRLPPGYPISAKLEITSIQLEQASSSSVASSTLRRKSALNALPNLITACRNVASEEDVEEALFLVFSRAEEWIQEDWPTFCKQNDNTNKTLLQEQQSQQSFAKKTTTTILGRRLIYSHHIISKIKRGDIKRLASDYQLTGYMKIGWPGLIIIEGEEQDCLDFYDEIRPWSWQYLVVRGEQQEQCPGGSIQEFRKFHQFLEVDDMSVVAQHCRDVGLEPLFRTSMKVYNNNNDDDDDDDVQTTKKNDSTSSWYGTLIHVDHMNDGKGYRKWLRKASQETDCALWIKQFYPNNDYTNRPKILVAIGGDQENVTSFLKRWRTSRVDLDSRGKPCLERQMTVIFESNLDNASPSWEDNAEGDVTDIKENVAAALDRLGGSDWMQVVDNI